MIIDVGVDRITTFKGVDGNHLQDARLVLIKFCLPNCSFSWKNCRLIACIMFIKPTLRVGFSFILILFRNYSRLLWNQKA